MRQERVTSAEPLLMQGVISCSSGLRGGFCGRETEWHSRIRQERVTLAELPAAYARCDQLLLRVGRRLLQGRAE
jgi:hypothetical protein